MARHAELGSSALTFHNRHNVVPGWVHNSVGAQGGAGLGPSAHKGLELSFETDFLGPVAIGIEPLNAVHPRRSS